MKMMVHIDNKNISFVNNELILFENIMDFCSTLIA